MSWYFNMDGLGWEEFGPYDTEAEALAGMERVRTAGLALNDGVERSFFGPLERKENESPRLGR